MNIEMQGQNGSPVTIETPPEFEGWDEAKRGAWVDDVSHHVNAQPGPPSGGIATGDSTVTQDAQNALTAKADADVPFQTPEGSYRGNVLPFMTDAKGSTSLAMPEMLAAPIRGIIKGGQAARSQRPAMSLSGDTDLTAAAMVAQPDIGQGRGRAGMAPKEAPPAPTAPVTSADISPGALEQHASVSRTMDYLKTMTGPDSTLIDTTGKGITIQKAAATGRGQLAQNLQGLRVTLQKSGGFANDPTLSGDLGAVAEQARRHTQAIDIDGLLARVDDLPAELRKPVRETLLDINNMSDTAIKQKGTGTLEAVLGRIPTTLNPLRAANTIINGGGHLGVVGKAGDMLMGNAIKAPIEKQLPAAQAALEQAGINPGSTADNVAAIRGYQPPLTPAQVRLERARALLGRQPDANMEPPATGGPSPWQAPATPGVPEPTGLDLMAQMEAHKPAPERPFAGAPVQPFAPQGAPQPTAEGILQTASGSPPERPFAGSPVAPAPSPGLPQGTSVPLMRAMEVLEQGRKERPFAGQPVQPFQPPGAFDPTAEGISRPAPSREQPFAGRPVQPFQPPGAFDPTAEGVSRPGPGPEQPFAGRPVQPFQPPGSFTPNVEGVSRPGPTPERPFAGSPVQPFQPPGSFAPSAEGVSRPGPVERPFAGANRTKPVVDHGGTVEEPHADLMAEMEALDKRLNIDPDTGLPRHDPIPVNVPVKGLSPAPASASPRLPSLRPNTASDVIAAMRADDGKLPAPAPTQASANATPAPAPGGVHPSNLDWIGRPFAKTREQVAADLAGLKDTPDMSVALDRSVLKPIQDQLYRQGGKQGSGPNSPVRNPLAYAQRLKQESDLAQSIKAVRPDLRLAVDTIRAAESKSGRQMIFDSLGLSEADKEALKPLLAFGGEKAV